MNSEKRRFSRILFNVGGKLSVDDTVYTVDRISNLSVGGCLLEIGATHLLDRECKFTILLSRMAPGVDVYGKVVRVSETELSIQFTRIDPDNLYHLQNIIKYNAEDPEQIEAEIGARPGLK